MCKVMKDGGIWIQMITIKYLLSVVFVNGLRNQSILQQDKAA